MNLRVNGIGVALALGVLCLWGAGGNARASDVPFSRYPVRGIYHGPTVPPDPNGFHMTDPYWAPLIKAALARRIQFAGKFIVVNIHCGTGCDNFVFVDKSSGRTMLFPLHGANAYWLRLSYRRNSALVRARWLVITEDPSQCWHAAFVLQGGQFTELHRRRLPMARCDSM